MKLTWRNISFILIFATMSLFTIVIWQRQTIRELKKQPHFFAEYDTTIIENIISDTIYPAPITLVNTVYQDRYFTDTVFTEVDTAAILADYHKIRTYKDILVNNDTLICEIEESVHRNALTDRRFNYSVNIPEKTITITQQIPQRGLYMNFNLMSTRKFNLGLDANLMYINKKNRLINVGAMYTDELYFKAGIGYRF